MLEGFEMTQDQFIDLCILLGCDYVDKIRVRLAYPPYCEAEAVETLIRIKQYNSSAVCIKIRERLPFF